MEFILHHYLDRKCIMLLLYWLGLEKNTANNFSCMIKKVQNTHTQKHTHNLDHDSSISSFTLAVVQLEYIYTITIGSCNIRPVACKLNNYYYYFTQGGGWVGEYVVSRLCGGTGLSHLFLIFWK